MNAKSSKTLAKNATPKTIVNPVQAILDKRIKALKEGAKEYSGLLYHYATVDDGARGAQGKELRGKTVKVVGLAVSTKWGKEPLAFVTIDGRKTHVLNPTWLQAGDMMPAEDIVAIDAAREAERTLTVVVKCRLTGENEKSYALKIDGYASTFYIAKQFAKPVTDESDFFEVPAWTIRQRIGAEALDAIKAKQDAWTAEAAR